MITVHLNDDDYQLAITAGLRREQDWQKSDQPSLAIVHEPEEHLIQNIRSAASEIAVARYLDAEWLGAEYGGPAGADVHPNIEVRLTTRSRGLFIKRREVEPGPWQKRPSTPMVLTYMGDDVRDYDIVGFIQLDYALHRAKPYQKNGKTYGYTVDALDLWPIEKLKKVLA